MDTLVSRTHRVITITSLYFTVWFVEKHSLNPGLYNKKGKVQRKIIDLIYTYIQADPLEATSSACSALKSQYELCGVRDVLTAWSVFIFISFIFSFFSIYLSVFCGSYHIIADAILSICKAQTLKKNYRNKTLLCTNTFSCLLRLPGKALSL